MTTQPSRSRFPWLAVIIAGFLALAGVGLLAYAVLSVVIQPGAQASRPTATAAVVQPATQAIAQANATPIVIPTITEAPQQAPSEAASQTAPDTAPAPTAEAPTAVPATAVPTADLNLKILQPANVRSGPGLVYSVIGGLQAGASVPPVGRDASGQWFVINTGVTQGWVSGIVATYGGDVSALPVVAAPPTPIPTPVPPTATPVPTAVPVATNPPAPVGYSSHGIVGNSFDVAYNQGSVGAQIWFGFSVTNTSSQVVEYSALAAHTDVGYTAWSWTMQRLQPGQTLTWRDNIKFDKAGVYQLYLGICYAGSVDACRTATWDRLSPNVTVTIQ